MLSIAEEIQAVSENADKCINYPIGDRLAAFIKHQDDENQTNFVLSGVLVYAAAKIFGRKVDYLEQEIHGIAKNFEAIETSEEKQPEKEKKKSRTKKFKIQDSVNVEKVSFEEKPIQILTKADINKTLATPSRINRLQRMKEFFSKNKSKTGKLVIPKSLLFTNDNVLSNFGSTQIHDYDDHKDIVGSRRDFTSFSYFINNCTGELQSDISSSVNNPRVQDIPCSPIPRSDDKSPVDWETRPCTPMEPLPEVCVKDFSEQSINIDEGIEMDESEIANMLLAPQPAVKLVDLRVKSPSVFPPDVNINDTIDMNTFKNSVLTVQHQLNQTVTDFDLPAKIKSDTEAKMRNIFMIPMKKLKHRCLFDLPNDEFGELKKRRKDRHKSTVPDALKAGPQARLLKSIELMKNNLAYDHDEPFLGFTKEQQQEPLTWINTPSDNRKITPNSLRDRSMSALTNILGDVGRKYSNDSGLEMDSSDEVNESTDKNLSGKQADNNISGGDSCYLSFVSGDSSKTNLSSFFEDIESRNNTVNESEALDGSEARDDSSEKSEERVAQMQQSAMNIAKWKEYLKPILAGSEARSRIDMHQYGVEMIDRIGNVNDTATLADIAEMGKTPAYFLTMLQLINNRNVSINFGERSMAEPVDSSDIKITLKSKLLHRDKFDEMGQQFTQQEEKKISLKRKAVQTSTPDKRARASSISFVSPNVSQSMVEDMEQDNIALSQASSGYFSQSSMLSDC